MTLFISYVTFLPDIEEYLRSTLQEDDHMLLFYSPSERTFGEKTLDLISEDRIKIRKLPGNLDECIFLICYELGTLLASGKYKSITLWGGELFSVVYSCLLRYDKNLVNCLSIKPLTSLKRNVHQNNELQFKKIGPIKSDESLEKKQQKKQPDKRQELQKEKQYNPKDPNGARMQNQESDQADRNTETSQPKKNPKNSKNVGVDGQKKVQTVEAEVASGPEKEKKNLYRKEEPSDENSMENVSPSNPKNNANKKINKRNHKGSQEEPPKAYSKKEASEEIFQSISFCESDCLAAMEHPKPLDKISGDKKSDPETTLPVFKETFDDNALQTASPKILSMNGSEDSKKEKQKDEMATHANNPLEEAIQAKQKELDKKNETVLNKKWEECKEQTAMQQRQQSAFSLLTSLDTVSEEAVDSNLYEQSFEGFWNLLNHICQEVINEDNAHNVYLAMLACCGSSSFDLAKKIYKEKLNEFYISPKRAEAMYKKTQSNFEKLLNFFP